MSHPAAASLPAAPADVAAAADDFLRLAACPRCGGTRRALAEVADQLLGRCLDCGDRLDLPLATERHARLVGHADPRVLPLPRS